MPQWRKLHTKIVESLDFQEMPSDFTRLVWVLLPLALDREGRSLDSPALIKSRVMPLRDDVTSADIAIVLEWFTGRGMIRRYRHNGHGYFYIPTWHQYQGDTAREAPSSLPSPDDCDSDSRPTHDLLMSESRLEEMRVDKRRGESDADAPAVAAVAQMWEDGTSKTIKPSDRERIAYAFDKYGAERVRYAFQEAYDHEAMKWSYINAILKADAAPPKNKASPKARAPVVTEDWTQEMTTAKEDGNGHNARATEQQTNRGEPDSVTAH